MTRRKALTVAASLIGAFGLIFTLLLLSMAAPALSQASYAYKPGCHCGKPTTTTAKPTSSAKPATIAKPMATATKATPATPKKTVTAKKTATSSSAATTMTQASAKSASIKSHKTTTVTAKKSAKNTHSTSKDTSSKSKKKNTKTKAALGATVAVSFIDGDGGGSSGGGGTPAGIGGTEELAYPSVTGASAGGPPQYYLSPVAIAFLLTYGASFALYRTKRMRVATHRKVWNLLLLGTFLICGLLGLVLTVGITRDPPLELPSWLLIWHVETGIAMCFISAFHIGWHLRYYLAIVTSKRKVARGAAVEGSSATAPDSRHSRLARLSAGRGLIRRTDADRMFAFQRRQAARSESGRLPAADGPVWVDGLVN